MAPHWQPPVKGWSASGWIIALSRGSSRNIGAVRAIDEAAVDGATPARMIIGDAALGNLSGPAAAGRPRRRRWRPAAALPRLRCDRRRAGYAMRRLLGRDHVLR